MSREREREREGGCSVQFSSKQQYRPNGSLVAGTRVAESSFHGAAELQWWCGELRSDGLGPTTGPE